MPNGHSELKDIYDILSDLNKSTNRQDEILKGLERSVSRIENNFEEMKNFGFENRKKIELMDQKIDTKFQFIDKELENRKKTSIFLVDKGIYIILTVSSLIIAFLAFLK